MQFWEMADRAINAGQLMKVKEFDHTSIYLSGNLQIVLRDDTISERKKIIGHAETALFERC